MNTRRRRSSTHQTMPPVSGPGMLIQPLSEAFLYRSPESIDPTTYQWRRPLAGKERAGD